MDKRVASTELGGLAYDGVVSSGGDGTSTTITANELSTHSHTPTRASLLINANPHDSKWVHPHCAPPSGRQLPANRGDGPWLGFLLTCRQHVALTQKCRHFWPEWLCPADTKLTPTQNFCVGD